MRLVDLFLLPRPLTPAGCAELDMRHSTYCDTQADLTDDADKVFLLLKSEGIGTQLSLFWAAWAYVLEMAEAYERAALTVAEGRAW